MIRTKPWGPPSVTAGSMGTVYSAPATENPALASTIRNQVHVLLKVARPAHTHPTRPLKLAHSRTGPPGAINVGGPIRTVAQSAVHALQVRPTPGCRP